MKIEREWATPLTIGTFGLLAVTGMLMFFHFDTGLNKVVHEWLSWLLVGAVGLHLAVNLPSFKRHLASPRARAILAVCVLVLGVSFLPLGGSSEPPFIAPVRALAQAPLPVLAQVAAVSPETMRERFVAAGVRAPADSDSVASVAGGDLRRQMQLLGRVLATGSTAAPAKAGG